MLIYNSFLSLCVNVNLFRVHGGLVYLAFSEFSHKGSIFAFPISRVSPHIYSEVVAGLRAPTSCWKLVLISRNGLYTYYIQFYALIYRFSATYMWPKTNIQVVGIKADCIQSLYNLIYRKKVNKQVYNSIHRIWRVKIRPEPKSAAWKSPSPLPLYLFDCIYLFIWFV